MQTITIKAQKNTNNVPHLVQLDIDKRYEADLEQFLQGDEWAIKKFLRLGVMTTADLELNWTKNNSKGSK
jgi:hypothetical protein